MLLHFHNFLWIPNIGICINNYRNTQSNLKRRKKRKLYENTCRIFQNLKFGYTIWQHAEKADTKKIEIDFFVVV